MTLGTATPAIQTVHQTMSAPQPPIANIAFSPAPSSQMLGSQVTTQLPWQAVPPPTYGPAFNPYGPGLALSSGGPPFCLPMFPAPLLPQSLMVPSPPSMQQDLVNASMPFQRGPEFGSSCRELESPMASRTSASGKYDTLGMTDDPLSIDAVRLQQKLSGLRREKGAFQKRP